MKNKLAPGKTFCIYPWVGIYMDLHNRIKLCSVSDPVLKYNGENLKEVWNSKKLREIRVNMLKGNSVPYCTYCYNLEKMGMVSPRMEANKLMYNYLHRIYKTQKNGSINDSIVFLEVVLSNRCNFKCRMCYPYCSTAWFSDSKKLKGSFYKWTKNNYERNNKILDVLKSSLSELEILFLTGGEPFIEPLNYKIIDLLLENNKEVNLLYSTNLSMIDSGIYKLEILFSKLKKIGLHVSIDGIGKKGEYIRKGLNWENWLNNVDKMLPYIEEFNVTINVYNLLHFPYLYKFLRKNYPKIEVNFYPLVSPDFLSIQILSPDIKKRATKVYRAFFNNLNLPIEHRKKMEAILNYMWAEDKSYLCEKFKEFNEQLDKIRKESFSKTFPELKKWYESIGGGNQDE